VRKREVGSQLRCPLVADGGIRVPPLRQEGVAEIVVRLGEIVPDGQRTSMAAFGLRQLTEIGEDEAEIAADLLVIRQQLHGAPHREQCLAIVALRLEQSAEDLPAATILRMTFRQTACGNFAGRVLAALVESDHRIDLGRARPVCGSARGCLFAPPARRLVSPAAGARRSRQFAAKPLDLCSVESMLLAEGKHFARQGGLPAAQQCVDVSQPVMRRLRVCFQRGDEVRQTGGRLRAFNLEEAESMVGRRMTRLRLQDGAVELLGCAQLARLMTLAGLRQRLRQCFIERGDRRLAGGGRSRARVRRQAAHARSSPPARRRKPHSGRLQPAPVVA